MLSIKEILIKLSNKKVIIPLVIVILVIETIWAVSVLKQTPLKPATVTNTNITNSLVAKKASLSMKSSKTTYKIGEQVVVDVDIYSPKATDGTDVLINYDPGILSIQPVQGKLAITTGSLYSDYPVNEFDEKLGRITISGISSTPGGVVPVGLFGQVSFTAKKAGKTTLSFVFTPGSTSDSNVVQTKTAKDILGEVNNLEVTITP